MLIDLENRDGVTPVGDRPLQPPPYHLRDFTKMVIYVGRSSMAERRVVVPDT